ncbi:lipase 3-like [Formica exsecta]|uniref:lipase 3-like n=1 Tax=Formica exsecta TaxID=72781 RepID=UPI001143C521|nr:lipase 3-like [Formica exsecta]
MTTMLLPTFLFSILAFVRTMPSLPVFDQTDISSIDHRISAAINEFIDPQSPLVHPDADLTTLELVNKYGYNGQLHKVTTSDGYILELHRLTGRANSSNSEVQKPVAFVMHGLLCSSAGWVVAGPEKGLAYVLSDAGYDVWLGNARGSLYSREHVSLSVLDKEYWDFSWHEIGTRDLPAIIDYILKTTDQEKLFYLGHSQGTTTFFVMAIEVPEYQNKIQAMFAMAPVAYCGRITSAVMQLLARFMDSIDMVLKFFGLYEFIPTDEGMKEFQKLICAEDAITQPFCSNLLFLIAGYNKEQFNKTLLPIILGHIPAGASTKQIMHYAQLVKSGQFRQYDYGWLDNKRKYGSFSPPIYDLKKIQVPVSLHYSSNDWLANIKDVNKLYTELGNPYGKLRVPHDKFNHLDYMWANDVKSLLYDKILSLMTHFRK